MPNNNLVLRLEGDEQIILREAKSRKVIATLTRYRNPESSGSKNWKINFNIPPNIKISRERIPCSESTSY